MTDSSPLPANILALDQQMCFPFYAASNLLQQLYRPLLAPLRLTYAQYLVMLVLWEKEAPGGLSVGDIGMELGFESGTLSPLLKRMEALGHLQRKRSPEDERRVLVTLTEEGRSLREKAQSIPARLLGDAPLDEAQLRALRDSGQNFVTCLRNMLHKRAG